MVRINVQDDEGSVAGWFDPDKALAEYEDDARWDGQNHVSRSTGVWYRRETLYRTAGGRWVLNFRSVKQGEQHGHRFLDDYAAQQWLIVNELHAGVDRWFGELESERGPGRPSIGGVVEVSLGDLLPAVNAEVKRRGVSRAALLREYVEAGLRAAELRTAELRTQGVDGEALNQLIDIVTAGGTAGVAKDELARMLGLDWAEMHDLLGIALQNKILVCRPNRDSEAHELVVTREIALAYARQASERAQAARNT